MPFSGSYLHKTTTTTTTTTIIIIIIIIIIIWNDIAYDTIKLKYEWGRAIKYSSEKEGPGEITKTRAVE